MAAKVSEIERTVQSGSTTTIERATVRYDGAKIAEVTNVLNGAPNGNVKVTYGGGGIERVEYTDKQGDRATDTLTYTDGNLTRLRYEVPGVVVTEHNYNYFAEDRDVLKEIATTNTTNGGIATSRVARYEYDAEGRVAKITNVQGSQTSSFEYRYNADGQLDRATLFTGTSVGETYTFSYLPDGKLDEVVDSKNNRYEVTYDKSGKIVEVRHATTTGTITTTRYSYASGNTSGWTYAPELPAGDLFDLGGKSYGDVAMLHGAVPATGDIPKGAPTGGVCTGFEPQDACDTCLANSCCAQTKNCLQGTQCYAFAECASACTTTSCQDGCRASYPTGSAAYDQFAACAQSSCSAQCQ